MKSLETEYRKSQQEEIPDLWNRIEAALSEKKPQEAQPERIPQKKILTFNRFGKMAAAVLLLALVVPGAWFLMHRGSENYKSDNAVMDMEGAENAGMAEPPDSAMTDDLAQSAEEPKVSAGMIVEEILSLNGQTVYYLRDENGTICSAVFVTSTDEENEDTIAAIETAVLNDVSAGMSQETLCVGEKYLFTLQAADNEDWDYEICNIEQGR